MALKNSKTQQAAVYEVQQLPRTFVVMDFETTALDPNTGRIIELGAARYTDGEAVGMLNLMVYQDPTTHPITKEVTKLTGHTQEDVLKGVPEDYALDLLISFIGGDDELIVGQNIIFDYSFMQAAADRYGWAIAYNMLDTLTIARDRKPYPHKLENLASFYGIQNEGNFHSAYYDALTTGDVLLAMHAEDQTKAPGRQVADYINVIGYREKYGPPAWVPDWVTLKVQGSKTIKEGIKDHMVIWSDNYNRDLYDEKIMKDNLTKIEAEAFATELNKTRSDSDWYRAVPKDYELAEHMPF